MPRRQVVVDKGLQGSRISESKAFFEILDFGLNLCAGPKKPPDICPTGRYVRSQSGAADLANGDPNGILSINSTRESEDTSRAGPPETAGARSYIPHRRQT
jgi:hypothetical protein